MRCIASDGLIRGKSRVGGEHFAVANRVGSQRERERGIMTSLRSGQQGKKIYELGGRETKEMPFRCAIDTPGIMRLV